MTANTNKLSLLLLALWSIPSWADSIPNASQLLQQQQEQRLLTQPQAAATWEDNTADHSGLSGQQSVSVKRIQFEGNASIASADLHRVVADAEGHTLSLSQLQQVAERVSRHYQQHGYPYHRAYLPPQNLSSGVVTIRILEAKYDQIQLNNQSRTRDSLLQATVAPLQNGQVIQSQDLERNIKLLNRLNGVNTRSVISAGSQTGSSNLNIDVLPSQPVSGYVGLDNYGNEYTGEVRLNAGVSANNLLGMGDQLSFEGTTAGKRFNYGKLAYELTLNGAGTKAGISYSRLEYELGKELKVLEAEGSADQASVWLSHPLVLNNQTEVVATTSYDHKRIKDDVGLAQSYRHRNVDTGRIRLDAFHFDNAGGGGLSQFGVGMSVGHVDFTNDKARALDEQTTRNQGSFKLFTANLSRLQNLGKHGTQLYAGIQGQYSPDNLEADGFSAGGPYTVSGYKSSVLGGSTGYYAITELRQNLLNSASNQLLGKVYVDTAHAQFVADKWDGFSGSNKARIHSAGLGLDWQNRHQWQAQARIGFPFGKQPATVDERKDVQAWLNVSKRF